MTDDCPYRFIFCELQKPKSITKKSDDIQKRNWNCETIQLVAWKWLASSNVNEKSWETMDGMILMIINKFR